MAKAPFALKALRQADAVAPAFGYARVGVRFSELHAVGMLAQQFSGRYVGVGSQYGAVVVVLKTVEEA